MDLKNFEKAEYFVNRELSWLKFDDRVLSEARDKSLPLFEVLPSPAPEEGNGSECCTGNGRVHVSGH